jgi:hypothetical protein
VKKIVTVLFVSIFLMAFSLQAQAYVEGVWSMDIVEKIKAKVKGVGKYKDTDYFSDNWTFNSDKTFSIDGYEVGTWEIIGKKFYVYIDEAEISDILEQNLIDNADFPLDTTVSIYLAQASGKQNKDGSIKAKYKFQAIVEASGFTGKVSVKGKATGRWISSSPTEGDGGNGGSNGGGDTGTTYTISEYFAPGQGNTWTYVEEDEELTVQSVSGTEQVNGVDAVKIIDEDGDYNLWTNSDGLVFHKIYNADDVPGCGWSQFIFNPPIKVSDPVVSVGSTSAATSTLFYTDCSGSSDSSAFSYEITIEGVEDVTVPAGTFSDCLKIYRQRGFSNFIPRVAWVCPKMGLVKSVNSNNRLMELTDVTFDN